MGRFSLKSVFSAPLVVWYTIKKIKLNGFAGGIIFGAIFSLVVNVATIGIQEVIQKQRILEAVENEIVTNMINANNIVTTNDQEVSENKEPNMFHSFNRYNNDLWTQSTEPLQYIAQLESSVQTKVILYYSILVKNNNNLVDKYEKVAYEQLKDCYLYSSITTEKKKDCDSWNKSILDWEADTAFDMSKQSYDVLQSFHPTKDRLDSWFLKLMMGSDSVRVLSGK